MTESLSRESIFLRRFFLGVLVAALVFGCIFVVIAVLIEGFNDDQITMRLVVTPTIVLFCGCIGLMGAMIHQTGRLVGYIRVMLGLLLGTSGFWLRRASFDQPRWRSFESRRAHRGIAESCRA